MYLRHIRYLPLLVFSFLPAIAPCFPASTFRATPINTTANRVLHPPTPVCVLPPQQPTEQTRARSHLPMLGPRGVDLAIVVAQPLSLDTARRLQSQAEQERARGSATCRAVVGVVSVVFPPCGAFGVFVFPSRRAIFFLPAGGILFCPASASRYFQVARAACAWYG